ncbi:dCTP deaminase, dUMP-forming [subsurface metagenome]
MIDEVIRGSPMLMTNEMIRSAMQGNELQIPNFDASSLFPASYDARLGEEAITSSYREKINPHHKGLFIIPAGDFALVTTHESFALSASVAGHIGLRSHYSKKGLTILSGPQIDPGFNGVLVVGLANLSPRDITIPYKERFCTLEFYKLVEPASELYNGEYQSQKGISPQDLENIVGSQGMTFGEVIKSLGALSANVSDLSHWVKLLAWGIPAVVIIGMAVIGIIVALK